MARQEVRRYYAEAKTLDVASRHAEKADSRAAQREQAEAAATEEQRIAAYRAEQLHAQAAARVAEEQALAAEMERRMRESQRTAKEVQLLLDRSAELRQLKEVGHLACDGIRCLYHHAGADWAGLFLAPDVAACMHNAIGVSCCTCGTQPTPHRDPVQRLRAADVNYQRTQQLQQKTELARREGEYNAALEAVMEQQRQEGAAREAREAEAHRRQEVAGRQALQQQLQEQADLQRVAKVRGLQPAAAGQHHTLPA